jgi:hypothetical protein
VRCRERERGLLFIFNCDSFLFFLHNNPFHSSIIPQFLDMAYNSNNTTTKENAKILFTSFKVKFCLLNLTDAIQQIKSSQSTSPSPSTSTTQATSTTTQATDVSNEAHVDTIGRIERLLKEYMEAEKALREALEGQSSSSSSSSSATNTATQHVVESETDLENQVSDLKKVYLHSYVKCAQVCRSLFSILLE